jgi:ketosteroid isomerase-like protein
VAVPGRRGYFRLVDDLELIRIVMSAANRGEMDVVTAHVHDDFLGIVPPSMSAEPDTYAGPAGVQRYFDLFHDTVEQLEIAVHDIEDAGDWLIATGTFAGTGRASGLPLALDATMGVQIRDGQLYRMEAFPSLEEAREELAGR